jgi:hypothetical protein
LPLVATRLLVEARAQHREAALQAALDGRKVGAGALRDRARRQVLEVAQEDRGLVRLVEREHRVGDGLQGLAAAERVGRRHRTFGRRQLRVVPGATSFAAAPLVREVHERAIQPATDRPTLRRRLGDGPVQGLLRHVVGGVRIAQQVARDATQRGGVLVQFEVEFAGVGHRGGTRTCHGIHAAAGGSDATRCGFVRRLRRTWQASARSSRPRSCYQIVGTSACLRR